MNDEVGFTRERAKFLRSAERDEQYANVHKIRIRSQGDKHKAVCSCGWVAPDWSPTIRGAIDGGEAH